MSKLDHSLCFVKSAYAKRKDSSSKQAALSRRVSFSVKHISSARDSVHKIAKAKHLIESLTQISRDTLGTACATSPKESKVVGETREVADRIPPMRIVLGSERDMNESVLSGEKKASIESCAGQRIATDGATLPLKHDSRHVSRSIQLTPTETLFTGIVPSFLGLGVSAFTRIRTLFTRPTSTIRITLPATTTPIATNSIGRNGITASPAPPIPKLPFESSQTVCYIPMLACGYEIMASQVSTAG